MESVMNENRFEKGLKKMMEIDGDAGQQVIASLSPVFPDLARLIIEYSFGDIYSRGILSPREQEIAVVASLSAKGNARPQLKVHLNGALNAGLSQNEIRELILHLSGYAGFPCSINAMSAFTEVLCERDMESDVTVPDSLSVENTVSRYKLGEQELEYIYPGQTKNLKESLGEVCPDLVKYVIEFGYGDVYSRGILSRRERQIATIATLAALGNSAPQLEFHIAAGLNAGLSYEEMCEIMILLTVFAGFPAAINGVQAVKRVKTSRKNG
jgi:4-carboxymuconolactone decarboxylase